MSCSGLTEVHFPSSSKIEIHLQTSSYSKTIVNEGHFSKLIEKITASLENTELLLLEHPSVQEPNPLLSGRIEVMVEDFLKENSKLKKKETQSLLTGCFTKALMELGIAIKNAPSLENKTVTNEKKEEKRSGSKKEDHIC